MRPPEGIRLGPGREFDLIRVLVGASEALPPGILVGPGDDCAVLDGGLVASVDLSVEGVHFRRSWISMAEAGYRATAAALSDLAAVAAEPLGVLLSMALDPGEAEETASSIQSGATEACRGVGATILGGDLSRSPGPAVLDVVVLGHSDRPLLRSGSVPGDEVWVTGWLGGSRAAVESWDGGKAPPGRLRAAFVHPTPRIREARWLAEHAPLHAGIDLSDGLLGDAGHLAAAAEVALIIDPQRLPFLPELEAWSGERDECLRLALHGGEDYELCITAPPGALGPLAPAFEKEFGIPLSQVGEVADGRGVRLRGSLGVKGVPHGGFSHFEGRKNG
ncbi:MAG: thiamine-phosphate kinase [Gemmatimonadota bacterium]